MSASIKLVAFGALSAALGYVGSHLGDVTSNPTIMMVLTAVIGTIGHLLPSPVATSAK